MTIDNQKINKQKKMDDKINQNAIDNFEFASYARDYPDAFTRLLELLTMLSMISKTRVNDGYFDNPVMSQINATRIAAALMSLLTDKKFKVDHLKFSKLIVHKSTISSIFRVSGYTGTGSALNYFSNTSKQVKNKKEETTYIYKMLIIMGLADHNKQTLTFLMNLDANISTPYILSLLASYVVMGEKEHLIREQLLAFGTIMSQQPFDLGFSNTLSLAWMNCSYGVREDKHLLKGHLNIMMRQAMEKIGFHIPKIKSIDQSIQRPKIVIIAESFQSTHAMYRCFASHIKQLQGHFETVLITTDSAVDEQSKTLFDHCEIFSLQQTSIPEIATLISQQNIDMLFYLSLGMASWTIALLPFRFAPIQILAPGHPASAITDSIDYIFCDEASVGNPQLYTEKILIINDGVGFMDLPAGEKIPAAQIEEKPSVIRVAVAGKSFKINAPFLAACQSINSQVTRSLQWYFFVDEVGLLYQHARIEITAWLPNAIVIPRLPYSEYINIVNECDIAVGTFPFGGANTNIDLILLGIPKVFMKGSEMHALADAVIYSQFDIPSWLSNDNIEDWCKAAIKLINDDQLRVEISHSLIKQKPEKQLLGKGCEQKNGFVTALKWVWKQHEIIKLNDTQRVIVPGKTEAKATDPA